RGSKKRSRIGSGFDHECRQFRGVEGKGCKHQCRYQTKDKKGLQSARLRVWGRNNSSHSSNRYRYQGQQRRDVDQECERHVQLEWKLDELDRLGEKPVQDELGVCHYQYQKRPENDEMVDAERLGDHPFLVEGIEKHVTEAGTDVVEAVFRLTK